MTPPATAAATPASQELRPRETAPLKLVGVTEPLVALPELVPLPVDAVEPPLVELLDTVVPKWVDEEVPADAPELKASYERHKHTKPSRTRRTS